MYKKTRCQLRPELLDACLSSIKGPYRTFNCYCFFGAIDIIVHTAKRPKNCSCDSPKWSNKTKNLVLFSSIRKRKKIEKSVYIFSVPWLRLERPSMGVAAYLRCFCKFTALFVFAFSELTGCPTSPLRYPMTVQEAIMRLCLVCIFLLAVTCQGEMVNNTMMLPSVYQQY